MYKMKNVLVDFHILNFELNPKVVTYVYQVIKRFLDQSLKF